MLKVFAQTTVFIVALALVACDNADKQTATISLSAEPTSVAYDGTAAITWSASGVDYCIASGDWTGNIKKSGSKNLGPLTRDSLYILDCYAKGKLVSESVKVEVAAAQTPRIDLSVSPSSIGFQQSATLRWASEHVTTCLASGAWSGPQAVQGELTLPALSSDSEFRLTCQGPQGEISRSVRVDVFEAGIKVPRVKLTASPDKVAYNGSTTLSWDTEGADICRASGNWFGSKARQGVETVKKLTRDSRFTLSCSQAGGVSSGEGVDSIEVRVQAAAAPTVSLSASPAQVSRNGSVTLRWNSSHADSCVATGDWSGTRSIAGSRSLAGLQQSSQFTINCTGVGGLISATARVEVLSGDR